MKSPKPTLRAAVVAVILVLLVVFTTASAFAQTQQRTHTVQAGETLYSIARLYGVTVDAIAFANGITNPALIYVGQVLVIPGATGGTGGTGGTGAQGTYTVVAGDTLFSIARRFSTTVAQLQALNSLGSGTTIYVGQTLTVPAASTSPAATATPGAGTPAAPTATSAPAAQTTHTVAAGETLFRIALRYGVTVQQIAQANNLSNAALIYVGQVLVIPSGSAAAPTATATQGTPLAPTPTQGTPLAPTPTQGTPAAPTATGAPPTATQGTPQAPTATPTQTSATGATAPVVTLTATPTATTTPSPAPSATESTLEDATPTAIVRPGSVPASAPNLLDNPGFEGATREVDFSSVKVVEGWMPFYCDQPYTSEKCPAPRQGSGNPLGLVMGRPEYSQAAEPARLRGGSGAQQWFCFWRACQGGLYQVVETRPGALCEVGAYVQSVSAEGESEVSTVLDNSIWRIRVDLTGATQAFSESATLISSADFGSSAGHYDRYALITFTFTATSEQTAIFFENQRIWPIATNASYIDEAYLRCN